MMGTHLHLCYRDEECQGYGAPPRIYLHTPLGGLIVAVGPNANSQVWVPFLGYTDWTLPVTYDPPRWAR